MRFGEQTFAEMLHGMGRGELSKEAVTAARAWSQARLEYECSCVRLQCGPKPCDGTATGDYREIINGHEHWLGKPVDKWDTETLRKMTASVRRRYS